MRVFSYVMLSLYITFFYIKNIVYIKVLNKHLSWNIENWTSFIYLSINWEALLPTKASFSISYGEGKSSTEGTNKNFRILNTPLPLNSNYMQEMPFHDNSMLQ